MAVCVEKNFLAKRYVAAIVPRAGNKAPIVLSHHSSLLANNAKWTI